MRKFWNRCGTAVIGEVLLIVGLPYFWPMSVLGLIIIGVAIYRLPKLDSY